MFEKASNSPVLVSFASQPTPIWQIPFPALTLCNMNKVPIDCGDYVEQYITFIQVRASRAKQVKSDLEKDPKNITLKREDFFIKEICEQEGQERMVKVS